MPAPGPPLFPRHELEEFAVGSRKHVFDKKKQAGRRQRIYV
jgi:hypothetical protein